MSIINFENVREKYRIKFIKEGDVLWEEFYALEDVSFRVEEAQVLGLIGQNGAGKTTLLKLIAGTLLADKGKVSVNGRVSMLMDLGAGFNPEFTGRENITLNARMYGLKETALSVQLKKIIAFSGLGNFIDAPVKYYSQGMYMRLAFSLAIFVDPDILLIDDILAVGDEEARQKCLKKIFEFKQSGKTIILVSHDMNMVNRLCDRVVFMEKGRIIREGPPARVIPYYLETVGDKKGLVVLEKNKLKIIFNNGKVVIIYEDNLITRGSGIFVSFLLPAVNLWFSSFDLAWQIKNLLADEITAEGTDLDGAVFLVWKILLRDNFLRWEVDIKDPAIKESHTNLFLTSDYKGWKTAEKIGEFPSFVHRSSWKEIDYGNYKNRLLGIIANMDVNALPSLTLEAKDAGCCFKLFNTGYEQEARVIQLLPFKNNHSCAEINFFSQVQMFEECMIRKKQSFSLEAQEDLVRLSALHTISVGRLRLFADIESRSLRLYFDDKELTKGSGLHSGFYISPRWFNSRDAQWRIEKVSEKELILFLHYEPIEVLQTWVINFKNEGSIGIKVMIEAANPAVIVNRSARLELSNEYKIWETIHESGVFSVNQEINNIIPIRLRDNKVSCVLLKSEANNSSPALSFSSLYQPDKQILGVYKRKEAEEEFICVDFSLIYPRKDNAFCPGARCVYFEGGIQISKEIKLKDGPSSAKFVDLNKGGLRFIFDRGKGRLFLGQKELTSGLGVYASMRSRGIWYDSYQALWRLYYKDDNKITVSGDWPHIPVSQTWQIELVDETLVSWEINMEIHEETVLEIEQSNLMLSCEYKNWMVPRSTQGEFLDEYTRDYDILPFRFWYGNSAEVAVKSRTLPRVVFKRDGKNGFLRSIIENTDDLYCARILQYQKANNRQLAPGKYKYFEGLIEIGNEE